VVKVKYIQILEETCDDTADCKEVMATTNASQELASHMIEQVENGGFVDILKDNYNMTVEVRSIVSNESIIEIWEPISKTGTASGSTDVFSYVRACKCDGAQYFACNDVPHTANNELFVCIWSIRSSEVEIAYLDSMVSIVVILCS